MPSQHDLQTFQTSTEASSVKDSVDCQHDYSHVLQDNCRGSDSRDALNAVADSADTSSQQQHQKNKPEHSEPPYHVFTPGLKTFLVFLVSAIAALSGLSSNIYFPAQEDISIVCLSRFY